MNKIAKKIILFLVKNRPKSAEDVNVAKRLILRASPKLNNKGGRTEKTDSMPDAAALIKSYHDLIKKNKIKPDERLLNVLKKRAVRTESGVAIVTVLSKPFKCPGQCVFCPNEKGMPKSYISDEPAAARALALNFDPYEQVARRIDTLEKNGHPTDKIELIIKGGTWNAYTLDYQYWFIARCFEAANYLPLTKRETKRELPRFSQATANSPYPLLERGGLKHLRFNILRQQTKNETAKHRIVGLTLETRPDEINEENIKIMRELGCTRVELGVQAVDDKILKLVRRGHGTEEIKNATRLLKNWGFKVDYHLMPQLPGATPQKDLKMLLEVFKNPAYRPDMIKIYPCATVENTELFSWLRKGKYKPYSDRQLINVIKKFKAAVPRYARISRLIRDIPSHHIKAGNKMTNLRQVIQKEMAEENLKCKCLRCREVGHFPLSKGERKGVCRPLRSLLPKLFIDKYGASGGIEYFLSYEDKKRQCVFAFCRLRFSSPKSRLGRDEGGPNKKGIYPAFIRELHTYGQLVSLKHENIKTLKQGEVQHTGFGKKLMAEAEKICRTKKITALAVISGIGVREYYRKLGYKLENGPARNALACEAGGYMVKRFR